MKLFIKTTDKAHAIDEARAMGYTVKAAYPRQGGYAVYATKPRQNRQTFRPEYFDPADLPKVAARRHYERKKRKGVF
jgi:hypothetical protein